LVALKYSSRDEYARASSAHEFSHILNGDTRLNMRLMALCHGLFWPTIVGEFLLPRDRALRRRWGESVLDENIPEINRPLMPLGFSF